LFLADSSHIPTHRFLAKNVKLSAFDGKKIALNVRTWRNGGVPALGWPEIWAAFKWPIIILLLGVLYHLLVFVGGGESKRSLWSARLLTF